MDLQSLINSQAAHAELSLPPGEFFGQVTIDKPLTIVGKGKSTCIVARSSPTIRITSAGVVLRNLFIECTAEQDAVAVDAAPETNPLLEQVILRGRIRGVPEKNVQRAAVEKPRGSGKVSFDPPPPLDVSSTRSPAGSGPSPSQQATGRTQADGIGQTRGHVSTSGPSAAPAAPSSRSMGARLKTLAIVVLSLCCAGLLLFVTSDRDGKGPAATREETRPTKTDTRVAQQTPKEPEKKEIAPQQPQQEAKALKWKVALGGCNPQSVVRADDRFVFHSGCSTGHGYSVVARDRNTGEVVWQSPSVLRSREKWNCARGTIFYESYADNSNKAQSFLSAVEIGTWRAKWLHPGKDHHGFRPFPGNSVVVIVDGGHDLSGLDMRSGQQLWGPVNALNARPTVKQGIFFTYHGAGTLVALEEASGERRWAVQSTNSAYYARETVIDNGIVCALQRDKHFGNRIIGFDAQTGKERWIYEIGSLEWSRQKVAAGVVCAVFYNSVSELRGIDITSGRELWRVAHSGFVFDPTTANGMLYGGGGNKLPDAAYLTAWDLRTGRIRWKFPAEGFVSVPAVADGVIYFECDGNLYALDIRKAEQEYAVK